MIKVSQGIALAAVLAFCSACAGMGSRPTPTNYSSPESLLVDYQRAMSVLDDTNTEFSTRKEFNTRLVNYFACKSFIAESVDVCEKIDSYQPIRSTARNKQGPLPPYRCEFLYWEGRMLHKMASGDPALLENRWIDKITAHIKRPNEAPEDLTDEELNAEYAGLVPYYVKGDLDGYCAWQKKLYEEKHDYRNPAAFCAEYIYLRGDPERCKGSPQEVFCVDRANLLRSTRQKDGSFLKGNYFEPLVNKNATCKGLGEKLISDYETRATPDAVTSAAPGAGLIGE